MGEWIPLVDYAVRKGVSLSTLRRHIKAEKVRYRIEYGRYLLFFDDALSAETSKTTVTIGTTKTTDTTDTTDTIDMITELRKLESDLRKAREEVAEMRTLVAFYEEQTSTQGV